MAVQQQYSPNRLLANVENRLTRILYLDGEKIAYLVLFVLAVVTRFYDLGARVMSHDESLHTRFSWLLYQGEGFAHTPLMHGPLLFHMTAFSYWLFGANDFTARIYTAVLGVALVMMPYFMRKWLGKYGALVASTLILISPMLLYYSRYIRHDIPSILAAVVMAVTAWRYIETRKFANLIWLAGAQSVLFASKEVSFIYVAIFGSFLTIYFIIRLMDVRWKVKRWRNVFIGGLIATIILLPTLGVEVIIRENREEILPAAGQVEDGLETQGGQPFNPDDPLDIPFYGTVVALALAVGVMSVGVIVGQWENLRRFPELDVAVVMGSLILPSLTPFVIDFAGFDPMATDPRGMTIIAAFLTPFIIISVVVGVLWGMTPPVDPTEEPLDPDDDRPFSWGESVMRSRWLILGGVYWAIYFFFFTTMFTNGQGLATGVIGSLGYWLDQHGVQRGGQPWYYYIMIQIPMYEFLPAILATAAGAIGLGGLAKRALNRPVAAATPASDDDEDAEPERDYIDLDQPIQFPVLQFVGWWAVMNLIAYSWAGEKMPWLTTHLTLPMILLGGWVVGRTIERLDWQRLVRSSGWVLLILIPMLAITLSRVMAPTCLAWEANPLCNTVIAESVQSPVFTGRTMSELSATGGWVAAAAVGAVILVVTLNQARKMGWGQFGRLLGLWLVLALGFLTVRSAWLANYINYDEATEYLVYAHSSGSVKDVLGQIEEISLKTTDGLNLKVAYDNKVTWPMTWYLRDYENAVYYGEDPSRGLIGDAPVILAGPTNWNAVEQITGERYFQFEYIRMWWPVEHYKVYTGQEPTEAIASFAQIFQDPDLQRGLWDIFYYRDYEAYSEAVVDYRPNHNPITLAEWSPAERMRVYIRKDVAAEVWDYGVAASELAAAVDPYSQNVLAVQPDLTFGRGELDNPHGIARGPEGEFYVADTNNHRIAVFSPTGELIGSIGEYGITPTEGTLNEPWDVAVASDGSILVADTWNFRVVRFSAEGEFLNQWGINGPGQTDNPFALWGPRGIAVDQDDRVYVSDTGNKRIQVYTLDGDFVRQIGSGGALQGELDEPAGLAVGPDGLIYVADTWNQRVQVFTPDGLFVRQWFMDAWFAQSNERPYLDVSDSGAVYVTDPDGYRIVVFDQQGQFLYSFGDFNTLTLAGPIVLEPGGAAYVVDTGEGVVKRMLPGTGPALEGEGQQ